MAARERMVLLSAIALAVTAFAEPQAFERYQSIVDRQMFGPLPPNFDPAKKPSEVAGTSRSAEKQLTQEQEKLKSSVRFSLINVCADGTVKVGFTDNADPKNPQNYYLAVGESQDGWVVNAADAEKATVSITKGDVSLDLDLGGDSGAGAGKMANAKGAGNNQLPSRSALLGGMSGTARARRAMRQAEEQRLSEESAKQRAAEEARREEEKEAEKAEREAEREEQRKQLMAIQEELKKAREESKAKKAEEGEGGNDSSD